MNPAEAYDSYLVPAMFEPWSREVIQRAKVWNGDRVLDVACGTGIVACRIAATGAAVTGLDMAPAMLAQARKRAEAERVTVKWVERDAAALGFANGSFDLVTCQQGLQFMPDRAMALREMRRVIAPGGRAVVACWASLEHHPAYKLLGEIASRHFGETEGGFGLPFSLGDEAEFRRLMTAAGFHAVAIDTVTRTVRFPEPATFIHFSLTAAAAYFPALTTLDPETRAARIAAAAAVSTPALSTFIEADHLVVQTTSMLATGRVPHRM